tara:strand:- start:1520 stop:2047 length:528 start_codon:yes stop_codon:yes gene_type:complete
MMFSLSQIKSANGKPRTKSLFYELSYDDPSESLFTLKERDIEVRGKPMLSLQQLYVSMVPNDPTEYEFAMTVFGSWDCWQAMNKSPYLKPHIAKWRAEAEVKVKSEAIKAIATEMKEGGRSSFSAAKLLLEKGWLDKEATSQAKRKLKEKEDEDLNRQALSILSDDAQRLGIKIN